MDESVLLLALSRMLDEKLQPIHCRLEGLEQTAAQLTAAAAGMSGELSALAEGQAEIRDGVNALLGWADEVAATVKVPLRPAN
ncbi:hypothetical protein [Pseudoflavonifractor phocaeensis]|uniref:hypothetical protein n=1 Tax=Pseudoflavonifractor phocaeensis TaxID=1870988 RepID=UPI0019583B79|nr:hypothetical protein [Pseudoflavonifractor phocaeensis]MBM6871472.1 hypothetical protein [Pseudoflavonifractor phocaeensis]